VYAVLMWWFCQLRTTTSARAITWAALIALGIALEFAQRMTEVRAFEVADMIAGALGATAGWLLAAPLTPNLLAWCERRLSRAGASPPA
jgi:glycopeptide antibiotics resistance protein